MVGKITSHNHEICYHAITVFESLNETIGVCNGLRKKKNHFNTCLRSVVHCLSLPLGENGWH